MQSSSLHRLTVLLCSACLTQLVVIQPSLAAPSSTARSANPAASSDATHPVSSQQPTISNTAAPDQEQSSRWRWLEWDRVRRALERFAPSVSFYYKRSVADYDSSDFSHSLGFIGGVDYNALPSLIFSTDLALYRELGEEYERFVASNWRFSATRTFDLPRAGRLLPRFFFFLPTNPDDREYLTYRGTIGADVELRKSNLYRFHKDHAFGGSVGFATARNIYDQTANQAGFPNRIWQVSGFAALNYKFRRSLMAIVRFRNNWFWYPEGNRANDVYQLSAAIHYSPIQQIWLALSTLSEDRTFLYDQVSLNAALYAARATSVIFSMTYLPTLSKNHELNR